MPWLVVFPALILSVVWAVMFLRQLKGGLSTTALDDRFTWGLYVQGFFFFSALAGGILIFVAVNTLFAVKTLRVLVEVGAAVSFSCLVAAGILLGSDLGKPFRGMKILTGKNFASPLTWDFYMVSLCGILNLIFLAGLVPAGGALSAIWAVLCLAAALGFVMIHTLFFLSRVGAGFRSQPFLGLDTLAQSLWGGMALMTLIALASEVKPFYMGRLLLILTVFTLVPLAGGYISNLSNKRKGMNQKKVLALDVLILAVLLVNEILAPQGVFLLTVGSLLILFAVYFEKSHLMREYQIRPTLPLPYSRYEEIPDYSPSASEWVLAFGSLGVCVFLSSVILYLKVA